VAHLELHTPNLARAVGFYTELLGWPAERIRGSGRAANRSYLALDLGNGLSGGIVECGTQRSLWLPYVSVEQVTATTERAQDLGASVVMDPREGPAGWRSVVSAPDGGEVAFWQSKGCPG